MNFKHPFLVITLMAICRVMASCSNHSSGTENNSDMAKASPNTNTFVSNKKLPKGASRLYNLPPNVQGFVRKNYPGYLITIAVAATLCGVGDAVDVAITKIGSPDLSLIFKPDGTFVLQEQEVSLNTAPHAIIQTLKAKYPFYSPESQIKKLTLADNTVDYRVELKKRAKSKEVTLDTSGIVICEN